MNTLAIADAGIPRTSFTLGSALTWLGHDYPSQCSRALDSLMATIWFVRQTSGRRVLAESTLIALDLGDVIGPAVRVRQLLHDVNACVATDHVRVVRRPSELTALVSARRRPA